MWGSLSLIAKARKSWARLASNYTLLFPPSLLMDWCWQSSLRSHVFWHLLFYCSIWFLLQLPDLPLLLLWRSKQMSPCLLHSHHISRLHLQTWEVIFRIIKGEKEILPSSKRQVRWSRPKHDLHHPFVFPQVQRKLFQPHMDNHPSWETSNMRNALTDKSNLGRGWKKAAFNHRSRHAELLSEHPRHYQKTQSMPGGMFTSCTCDTVTAWHSSPSAATLGAHAWEPADPPWAAQPGSRHRTQPGAHLKSWA